MLRVAPPDFQKGTVLSRYKYKCRTVLLPRGFLLARLRSEKWWYYGTVYNREGHLSQSKIHT